MSLRTYRQTRPFAASIKEQVLLRKMPPWDADPHVGKFSNDRSLSQREIDTLAAWATSGAKEGVAADSPAPRIFIDGWNIAKPDIEIKMPHAFHVPASGDTDYQYIVLPTGFKEDQWVTMAELRPSVRAVVHHALVFVREPGNNWLRGEAEPGIPFSTKEGVKRGDIGGKGSELFLTYTPGVPPEVWRSGQAKMIPAGSDLVLQIHYSPNGVAVEDQTSLGLVLAKEMPKQRILSVRGSNDTFEIPPGAPNYEVVSRFTFRNPGVINSLLAHMHVRGKDFEIRARWPDGRSETLLRIPKYNFSWQLSYKLETPLAVPAGTILESVAHFDNSPNNPRNPDPKAAVRFGEQSWEEMAIEFIDVSIDSTMSKKAFLKAPATEALK
ncbi:MAG: thiol-disulfide isomerase [Acidobacteriota bacterium]|nr:thiol-disulfide isomerase [Acidobacteriota bacterium]